jgi:hypothetical protein
VFPYLGTFPCLTGNGRGYPVLPRRCGFGWVRCGAFFGTVVRNLVIICSTSSAVRYISTLMVCVVSIRDDTTSISPMSSTLA